MSESDNIDRDVPNIPFLMDRDRSDAIRAIREGLEDVRNGRTQPARVVLERLRKKYFSAEDFSK